MQLLMGVQSKLATGKYFAASLQAQLYSCRHAPCGSQLIALPTLPSHSVQASTSQLLRQHSGAASAGSAATGSDGQVRRAVVLQGGLTGGPDVIA